MKKYLFIFLGTVSLIVGLCGLFVPGLPTTPFILLTGALYTKSSPKLYSRLEQNRITGIYLNRMKTGLSWKARLVSIMLMWTMVCLTAFIVFDEGSNMRYIMLGLGGVGTVAQLLTFRKKKVKIEIENEGSDFVDIKEVELVNN